MNCRLTTTAVIIFMGVTLAMCSHPVPADEIQDRTDRQWQQYQQDSERYRDRLEASQREQERANACLLAGERSAICRAYGDPYRDRRYDERRVHPH